MWLAAGLVFTAAAQGAQSVRPRTEIFSFSPSEGPAGTTIKVTGTGFENARHVLFCVGRTGRMAKFKVVSDEQIEVTAPPYLHAGA
ncbi:MAG TPA: IPT/TIG domain-containing protein, partial [Planctomycetaceae bacterium]|nr:IPT/TIG domain-containing protein [Planctomycetaceae bacterium]